MKKLYQSTTEKKLVQEQTTFVGAQPIWSIEPALSHVPTHLNRIQYETGYLKSLEALKLFNSII